METNLKWLKSFSFSGILLLSASLNTDLIAQETKAENPFFLKSPTLIRSATTFKGPSSLANYHFTIVVPQDAGQPLGSVTIKQQRNLEQITFFPQKSRAFFGTSFNGGESTSVEGELIEEKPNGVKVTFKEAIAPGNTVTVVIRARNPLYGGIYQFGITAFPQGNELQGLYLGVGRIHLTTPFGGS